MKIRLDANDKIDAIIAKYRKSLGLTEKRNGWYVVGGGGKPVRARWENVKKLPILRTYGRFRKEIVDNLVAIASREHECAVDCRAESVGSTLPTSDYDITVFGPKQEAIVSTFNRLFRERFHDESGDMFDTNLYGIAFYTPIKDPYTYVETKSGDYLRYTGASGARDSDDQRVWAFTKLLMYLPKQDAKRLVPRIVSEKSKKLFEAAMKRKDEMDRALRGVSAEALPKARNLKYTEHLRLAAGVRCQLTRDPGNKALQRKYKSVTSRANYYGSETYLTQGAFFHVVGILQSKYVALKPTKNEYIDSFIENIGDILKELQHLPADTPCPEIQHKISKYFHRSIDALDRIRFPKKNLKAIHKLSERFMASRGKTVSDTNNKTNISRKELIQSFDVYTRLIGELSTTCSRRTYRNHIIELLVSVINA